MTNEIIFFVFLVFYIINYNFKVKISLKLRRIFNMNN